MKEVAIHEKLTLTIEETAAFSNIGINRIRELTNEQGCSFVTRIANKKLIKRKKFEQYIEDRGAYICLISVVV